MTMEEKEQKRGRQRWERGMQSEKKKEGEERIRVRRKRIGEK